MYMIESFIYISILYLGSLKTFIMANFCVEKRLSTLITTLILSICLSKKVYKNMPKKLGFSLLCLLSLLACSDDLSEFLLPSSSSPTPPLYPVPSSNRLTPNAPSAFFNSFSPSEHLVILARGCALSGFTSSCPEWRKRFPHLSQIFTLYSPHFPLLEKPTLHWVEATLDGLKSLQDEYKYASFAVLELALKRLEYQDQNLVKKILEQIQSNLTQEKDPIWSTQLLNLLGRFTPLGQGQWIHRYTDPSFPLEVRSKAWSLMTERHGTDEPLNLKKLKKQFSQEKSLLVRGSLIRAAGRLRYQPLIHWCGRQWWEDELFDSCRWALGQLKTEGAFKALISWIRIRFRENRQTLISDLELAQSLTSLTPLTQLPKMQMQYRSFLDRFFSKKRADPAALVIAQELYKIRPSTYAISLIKRYYKASDKGLELQSHLFNQHLKQFIHQLGTQNPSIQSP